MRRHPTKDAWDLLAERTQRASRPLGTTTWTDIRIISRRNRITLKPSINYRMGCLFFAVIGIFFIIIDITQSRHPFAGILFGLLCFAAVFLDLNYIKHISWEIGGNNILIYYDLGPFYKKLKLNRSQLLARLELCGRDIKDTNVRRSAVTLSLERTDCAKQQVIIAISGKGTHLSEAFEKLSDFLSGQSTDATLAEVSLAQGQQALIPFCTDVDNSFSGQKSRNIVHLSNDMIILKRYWPDTIIMSLGAGLGLFFVVSPYFMYKQETVKDWRFWTIEIIAPLMGILFFVMGSYALIKFFRGWYLIANKQSNELILSGITPAFGKSSILCRLSEIGAFQLCSFISPGKNRDTIFYKLYAVLSNPLGTRLIMHSSTDREQISEQAKTIAKFLNVPFYDHVLASD